MKKLKGTVAFLMAVCFIIPLAACKDEKEENKAENPTPESVIETFFGAWDASDIDKIVGLTCEPMWKVEAESADETVEELKAQIKESYSQEVGSEVYYTILKTTEYKDSDDEYKAAYDWAKERYGIEIEGYAKVRAAVTYDNGEPVTQNMEVIKYDGSWYAKDLLGI